MKEDTIQIEGMMCGHCQMNVTKALSTTEGVVGVEVSLDPAQAKVNYDPERITIEGLKGVINEAGYKA
ncbi:MAG: heavy-metal-associated domain-containing protein [ANME-2 cluster archaeon]|nr:heavy-metal-associated domain-containing protein [ANME-2 cluster archaeon]